MGIGYQHSTMWQHLLHILIFFKGVQIISLLSFVVSFLSLCLFFFSFFFFFSFCHHWGERITRHNAIRDHVYSMAASAVLNPVKEGRFILLGDDRRPADIYLPSWAEGRDAALDVTVINLLQSATVAEAAETPGHSLTVAFERKMRGAADDCARQGVAFIPLAFESLGGWHTTAELQVRRLAQALARQTGKDESECCSQAISRLSLLLMKGNASILINRIPAAPDAAVDGLLWAATLRTVPNMLALIYLCRLQPLWDLYMPINTSHTFVITILISLFGHCLFVFCRDITLVKCLRVWSLKSHSFCRNSKVALTKVRYTAAQAAKTVLVSN